MPNTPANQCSLFFFIDALGWEILQRHHPSFLCDLLPSRKPLRTIFGYSSACDPSIISGLLPAEHGLWSSWYYSPQTSPFRHLSWLSHLPGFLTGNHRIRHTLSRWIAKQQAITGYFQIYQIPFRALPYFDYAEKKWIFGPHGLPKGKTIFDHAIEQKIPYWVNAMEQSDETNCTQAAEILQKGNVSFVYTTLGKLDALMHRIGTQDAKISELLRWYEKKIQALAELAAKRYDSVNLMVFSDHGMHDIRASADLQTAIERTGWKFGPDYVAMYDSTMARFWFPNRQAKKSIITHLEGRHDGRIILDSELATLGVFFPDYRYGEVIFLMNPGTLIVPSFMGSKQIPGMHGYHPDEPDSTATLLSSSAIPESTVSIHQIFHLMLAEIT